jgi:ABC-2 type transport system ATP-binding protein
VTAPLSPTTDSTSGPRPAIVVDDVSKWFRDVVAVSEVSFTVGPGVTALLGPNGAGKSTLFRVVCGLVPPSRGTVRVLGGDPRRDRTLRGRIGLVPQQDALFEPFTAVDFVRLAAGTQGIAHPDAAARAALALVDLDPDDRRPCSAYSKGMRQRVKVAAALVHEPEVVILDEPLTGLDPVQRRRMITLFQRLGSEGRCVLVSSHVLDEVARLGSRILVIAQGRLAASGDFRALRELMDDRPHRIQVRTDTPERLAVGLIEAGVAVGIHIDDDGLVVDTRDADAFGRRIAPVARECDVRLREVNPLDDDLESVFRYLVERR